MKLTYLIVPLLAAFANHANAGVGCDLNLRVNNQTPNSITVFGGPDAAASKAGLNLWNPVNGFSAAVLDPSSAGAASHTKQAVELELPCWTGKVDFRFKYLDGSTPKWKYRNGVSINSGDTVQINIP